jgi:hypothetical protein
MGLFLSALKSLPQTFIFQPGRKNPTKSVSQLFIFILIILYIIVGLLLSPRFQYVINADGISYLSIAQKYLSGFGPGATERRNEKPLKQ